MDTVNTSFSVPVTPVGRPAELKTVRSRQRMEETGRAKVLGDEETARYAEEFHRAEELRREYAQEIVDQERLREEFREAEAALEAEAVREAREIRAAEAAREAEAETAVRIMDREEVEERPPLPDYMARRVDLLA